MSRYWNETADTGIVQVIPTTAPDDPATAELVRELRAQHDRWLDEYGIDIKVTGFTAVAIDISDRLAGALIPFGLFVIGLSLVLLTIVFRSIWVPIKATLGYLLSVGAAFGAVGAVFGWGWFADLLNVSTVGPIISFLPIVLMGVLFGLAMDYEVFLVARMREDYVRTVAPSTSQNEDPNVSRRAAIESGFVGSALCAWSPRRSSCSRCSPRSCPRATTTSSPSRSAWPSAWPSTPSSCA